MKAEGRRQKPDFRLQIADCGLQEIRNLKSEIRNQCRHLSSVICRQGFTLIEIVVAIGILVMVIGFAGVIFQKSIGAYRTASAQTEIMRKLRVITEQLDSDFRGLRKDAPMFIWFEFDPTSNNNRFDQIMFFADGDFQSTQTYNGNPVVGNVARIYYGQAQTPIGLPTVIMPKTRILARRQHILTADTTLPIWLDFSSPANFANTFTAFNNDANEYDCNSLSQWQAILNDPVNGSSYAAHLVAECFYNNRPQIDFSDANTIHNFMTDGISSFSIQWDYITDPAAPIAGAHFWWPALDPDGDGDMTDNDFDTTGMNQNPFGFYFNSESPSSSIWFSPTGILPDGPKGTYYPLLKPDYPKALKFVFTIYDSRGVFPEGQTFSHIVYLGD